MYSDALNAAAQSSIHLLKLFFSVCRDLVVLRRNPIRSIASRDPICRKSRKIDGFYRISRRRDTIDGHERWWFSNFSNPARRPVSLLHFLPPCTCVYPPIPEGIGAGLNTWRMWGGSGKPRHGHEGPGATTSVILDAGHTTQPFTHGRGERSRARRRC